MFYPINYKTHTLDMSVANIITPVMSLNSLIYPTISLNPQNFQFSVLTKRKLEIPYPWAAGWKNLWSTTQIINLSFRDI